MQNNMIFLILRIDWSGAAEYYADPSKMFLDTGYSAVW